MRKRITRTDLSRDSDTGEETQVMSVSWSSPVGTVVNTVTTLNQVHHLSDGHVAKGKIGMSTRCTEHTIDQIDIKITILMKTL